MKDAIYVGEGMRDPWLKLILICGVGKGIPCVCNRTEGFCHALKIVFLSENVCFSLRSLFNLNFKNVQKKNSVELFFKYR